MDNKFRFTMERLQAIPTPDKRTVYYDISQPGLRLLVTSTGNKSFQFQMWSKKHAKPLTRTLGKFRTISLAEAREQSAVLITELNTGVDIERSQEESDRARRLSPTIQDFSVDFIELYCEAKKLRSIKQIQRIIDKDILPAIGRIKMVDIKRADLIDLIDTIQKRGALILCNRVHSVLSKMFNFAIGRGVVEMSPVDGLQKRGVEVKRERVLSNEEIKMLWNSLGNSSSCMLIKFLLLTGQRTGEARQLEWSELTTDNVWQIPSSKTKNKSPHKVPLSSGAMGIINHMKSVSNGRYAFPGKKSGCNIGGCCLDPNMASHHFQRAVKQFGWERTTVHDLRRTMRSKLSELGVAPMVAEKVLNHKIPGIISVYDHHEYFNEKQDALQRWDDLLQSILNDGDEKIPANS